MYTDMCVRLKKLEDRLGVVFSNQRLLLTAVTHRSYLNEHRQADWGHYEILEFLGDAVLELCVTEHLVKRFPDRTEGDLTNLRVALVNGETLGCVGEELMLGDVLLMSKGQYVDFRRMEKSRVYMLACAVEAILGALHQDQGIGACRLVVDHLIHTTLARFIDAARDYKSELQELAQAEIGYTPVYRTVREFGPDHAKQFVVAVFIGGQQFAEGLGASKKEGQKAAAEAALTIIKQRRDI